jgi:DNA-binding beta-propeller fold protein YncE
LAPPENIGWRLEVSMASTRKRVFGGIFILTVAALVFARTTFERIAAAERQTAAMVPTFEVDPFWPKPLPNHWVLGQTIGVSVDSEDHVWIVHRGDASLNIMTEGSNIVGPTWTLTSDQPWAALPGASRGGTGTGSLVVQITPDAPQTPATAHLTLNITGSSKLKEAPSSCCTGAPPVLEFDRDGNLIGAWGGPGSGYEWPSANHGITVDYKNNVWIGGNDPKDAQILKFTNKGQFLMQVGHAGKNAGSLDMNNFWRAAKIAVDPQRNEAYVADGYGNKRVVVIDADTGAFKRIWGAYGNRPDDTNLGPYDPTAPLAKQFRNPVHCAEISNDGLIYVCDRANDRLQVFQRDGTFVKEVVIAKNTLGDGSVWDLAFSRDPGQKFLFVADGRNEKVYVVLRDTLEVLTSFGDGGHQPGQFFGVHSIATDSRGNVYTTETYEGKRLQKFVNKGLGPVTKMDQGTLWPATAR